MFDAFVLAAGFGTRLRPLTEHRPKALVPVCGVPMLAYALASCGRAGLRHVVVNAHHLAEQLRPWEGWHEGVRVTLSVEEPDILGTGGGLKKVGDALAHTFVVVNADVLTDVALKDLRRSLWSGGATLALRVGDVARYGVVAVDEDDAVVDLAGVAQAASPKGEVDRTMHFTGIHAIERTVLDKVPDGYACIVRTAYSELVPKKRIRAMRHAGAWLDVGDPAAYHAANMALLDREVTLALDPWERAQWAGAGIAAVAGARVEGGWIGHGVTMQGATVRHSIIGDRARLAPGTEVVDCVVWDGVDVPAGRYERAVLYDGGALPIT